MSIWSDPIVLEDFVGPFCPVGITSSTFIIVTQPKAEITFENTADIANGDYTVTFDDIAKEVNFEISGVAYQIRADTTSTTVKKVQLVSPSDPRDVQEWEATEEN